MNKDPTLTLGGQLDRLLNRFVKEGKLDRKTQQSMRVLHPCYPQLYGQPKIHKPNAPIRPIVSFYNTPLSALHKVLASFLKPLAQNRLRLKDSVHFKQRLSDTEFQHPDYTYLASLDVKALYTNCDMRKATATAVSQFRLKPNLLPPGISPETIGSLISFCLDNSYFEFNNIFYKQNSGGTMGSPLIVELSEIRTAETELLALSSCPNPPIAYNHFVDDGIGAFKDRTHAEYYLSYLNSRNTDLQYTIEHPKDDGSLPFLDILIHADRSTSVYRKPTHTNLYVKYNSTTPNSTKDSVIRSLAQRAFNLCSPQHLDAELDTVHTICLKNGFPSRRIHTVINKVGTKFHSPKPLSLKQFNKQCKLDSYPLHVLLPYHPSLSQPLKQVLQKHDIKVTFSSPTTLRNMLTKTKSTPPTQRTPNVVYEFACDDCPATYIGQTYRPLFKRTDEHERAHRLKKAYAAGNPTSAPAVHALETGHNISWNDIKILTTTSHRSQLNLIEHAGIRTRDPHMNRTDAAPNINHLWNPLLSKISSTFKPRPSNILYKNYS